MVSCFLYIWIMCPIYAYQIKVIMYVSLRDKIVFYNWREVQYTERYDQITIKTPTAYGYLPQFIYGF
jgi:hypothetical protein